MEERSAAVCCYGRLTKAWSKELNAKDEAISKSFLYFHKDWIGAADGVSASFLYDDSGEIDTPRTYLFVFPGHFSKS